MWTRYLRFFEIALVVFLIFMASGDDFHLCRIMVPSFFSTRPANTLPLDDPNTDFTKSDASQSLPQPVVFGFRDITLPGLRSGIEFTLPLVASRLNVIDALFNHAAHADPLTPLRC